MPDDDPKPCPNCGRTEIPVECGGRGGWPIQLDDGRVFWKHCRFMQAKILRSQISSAPGDVGKEISSAQYLQRSLLIDDDDLTDENVFIQSASWETVKRHIKRALVVKLMRKPNFSFRFTTDAQIKNVFVGNEHYAAQSRNVRDDIETNNSLEDLMGSHDLVILRLARLGYKNIAGGGSLKEALLFRDTSHRPTWLIDSEPGPGNKLWIDSPTWNHDVGTYVDSRFKLIALEELGDNPPPVRRESSLSVDEEEESPNIPDFYAPSEASRIPGNAEVEQPQAQSPSPAFEINMPGEGSRQKFKYKKRGTY